MNKTRQLRRFVPLAGMAIAAIASLSGCANSQFEGLLKPDPQLQENPPFAQSSPPPTASNEVQLPENFPSQILRYPNATLEDVTATNKDAEVDVITRWQTSDPSNLVQQFYQKAFQSKKWKILERPTDEGEGSLVATQDGLQVTISVKPNPTAATPQTDFEIRYLQDGKIATVQDPNASVTPIPLPPPPPPVGSISPTPSPTSSPLTSDTDSDSDTDSATPTDLDKAKAKPKPSPSPQVSDSDSDSQTTTQVETIPPELRTFVSDVAQLGVLQSGTSSTQTASRSSKTLSNPNTTINRGEYARWLVNANNNYYGNQPAKQIRLGVASDQPVFTDVPTSHPYFAEIQGLAEAGLIPSSLSGDSSVVQFRPDAALNREDLLLWKVPLDTRQALPQATVDAVKERWGFQDASKIDSNARRAVLADFDNGDYANIRRVFGFTTIFQPKKSVTRAEAAAALWYFGFQGEGISATEALQNQAATPSN